MIEELTTSMQGLSQNPTEKETYPKRQILRDMMHFVVTEGNGTIYNEDFSETFFSAKYTEEEWIKAFTCFDIDGDGFVKDSELKRFYLKIGENCSDGENDKMFQDADGDGKVDFGRFRTVRRTCGSGRP